jgi:hypothetical protein
MLGLGKPDDFRGDPYGWLTNQMSHVLCGIAGAWLVGLAGASPLAALAVVTCASAAVETVHLHRGGRLGDTLADVLYVVAGAVWQATGGSLWLLGFGALGLVLGVRSRLAERQTDAQTGDR